MAARGLRTMRLSSLVIEESLALCSKETSTVGPSTSSCRSRLAVLWAVPFLPPVCRLDRAHG